MPRSGFICLGSQLRVQHIPTHLSQCMKELIISWCVTAGTVSTLPTLLHVNVRQLICGCGLFISGLPASDTGVLYFSRAKLKMKKVYLLLQWYTVHSLHFYMNCCSCYVTGQMNTQRKAVSAFIYVHELIDASGWLVPLWLTGKNIVLSVLLREHA